MQRMCKNTLYFSFIVIILGHEISRFSIAQTLFHLPKNLSQSMTKLDKDSIDKVSRFTLRNLQSMNRKYCNNNLFRNSRKGEGIVKRRNIHRIVRSLDEEIGQEPKIWDQWGKWSGCSVTCGIGKITRWRHCIGGSCANGEKKAQLKTCTYPAC